MKIGVFSGTFDPIHNGHIAFIEETIDRLNLDKVVILVEHSPRRKSQVTDYTHRFKMVQLVAKQNKKLVVDDLGMQEEGRTHSFKETFDELYDHFGKDQEYVLMMGGDLFETIESWTGYKDYLDKISFAVGLRTEDDGELAIELAAKIGAQIKLIGTDKPKVSSNGIKAEIQQMGTSADVLPEILSYIIKHGLYRK